MPASPSAQSLSDLAGPAGIASIEKKLSDLAKPALLPTSEQIALWDAKLRWWVAVVIVAAFLIVNWLVLWGIWRVYQEDIELLTLPGSKFTATDRLVTTNLMITVIGATTVQLGTLIVLMGKYLFPAPRT
jgi:hypothetical protein